MKRAHIDITFPECVNRGDGPCVAWEGLVDQMNLLRDQGLQYKSDFERVFGAAYEVRKTIKDHGSPTRGALQELVDCVDLIIKEHADRQIVCARRS